MHHRNQTGKMVLNPGRKHIADGIRASKDRHRYLNILFVGYLPFIPKILLKTYYLAFLNYETSNEVTKPVDLDCADPQKEEVCCLSCISMTVANALAAPRWRHQFFHDRAPFCGGPLSCQERLKRTSTAAVGRRLRIAPCSEKKIQLPRQ